MPDWQRLVRERLGRLGLSPQRDDEIASELAGYLEDRFEESNSLEDSGEVPDWRRLRRDLRRASTEEDMNERTRSFWVPCLLTVAVASVLWRVLLLVGLEPRIITVYDGPWGTETEIVVSSDKIEARDASPVTFRPQAARGKVKLIGPRRRTEVLYLFTPWLIALPVIGAAGAFWSRRMGARPIRRLLVTVSPALGMMAFLSLGIVTQLVMNPRMFVTHTLALLYFLASFVFIPAGCLLLGALPFLRNSSQSAAKPV